MILAKNKKPVKLSAVIFCGHVARAGVWGASPPVFSESVGEAIFSEHREFPDSREMVMIRFRNIDLSYGEKLVFRGFSLDIARREKVILLGNSMRGNIIGIDSFYQNIRKDSKRYKYILSSGTNMHEAVLPYLRESVSLALRPTLASMATMGIVFLPGMTTGGYSRRRGAGRCRQIPGGDNACDYRKHLCERDFDNFYHPSLLLHKIRNFEGRHFHSKVARLIIFLHEVESSI